MENLNDDDSGFAIIENAQDVLKDHQQQQRQQQHRTIDERIVNNYYLEEYMSLENVKTLKQTALKCGLRSYRFRSIAWSIFLESLPEKSSDRIERIRLTRSKYQELQNKYRHDPREFQADDNNKTNDNPLSQDETSHWNQYFSDDELQSRIKKDVVRAFPDINFFQGEKIQRIMVDILFNYARENSNIEYKQGMHEILAPIIFVIHSDHQSFLFAQENGLDEEEIRELMDPRYLEHDSYFLFSHIMESIDSWYDNNSIQTIRKNEYVNMEPFSNDIDFNCYSKIGIKLKMITEQILRRHDEKLFQHLKDLKIAPQIYGIRWMRLLFIREFQMQDLLVLWDAIFAYDFSLCDYIFTAMLIVIRSLLLPCDYAECLNHLMRYPSVCDVHYVIHLALHYRDSLNYPEPVEHSTLVIPNPNAIKVQMANRLPPSLSMFGIGKISTVQLPNNFSNHHNHNHHSRSSSSTQQHSQKSNELKNVSFEWIEDKLIKFQGNDGSNQSFDCCQDLAQELQNLKYKTDFCSRYMTKHLEIIQKFINQCATQQQQSTSNKNNQQQQQSNQVNNNNQTEQDFESSLDNVLISIAELKKIRDILRGTIAL
ncbi:TBC1 domain, member 5 [Dermatophagoides pteronyssinus]|uniref:TBC1 domain, member 5 n=1 Tax=Dermatophagoides pteronyssinus TaxID=6956 RepID=A0ABQ8IRE2_DERPT|nr:TBC1 domain, member 5 [Dermatophagoides pteronyssinus]